MHKITIIVALLIATIVRAQSNLNIDSLVILSDTVSIYQIEPRPVPDLALPECALPDSNFMRLPSNTSDQMRVFVEKMDSVVLFGQGRVNILHIGGSHVQADIYTNVFRQNIDSLNGELMPPRGLIFPYSVAHTNNPSNYRVRYGGEWTAARNALKQFVPTQGVCGILAYTTDTTAWFSIDLNPDSTIRWTTNHVHLIGSSTSGRIKPQLITTNNVVIEPQKETTGYYFDLPEAQSLFTIRLTSDTSCTLQPDTFIVNGIVADNDEPGIVYSSIGVNGASVPSYLGCDNFERDLSLLKPDLAIFAIGINDATASNFTDSLFVANYDMLLKRIRNVSPQCAFIFITNNDSFKRIRRNRYSVNKNGVVAQHGFYTLAEKWNAPVWDLFEIMGGLSSMQKWQTAHLAQRDKVHFTREGYCVIGQMFFDAFMDYYLNFDISTEQ